MPPSAANPASGIEPASESLWPAPSFLGQAVGAVGFAPFVQAAHSKGTIEQLSEALSVLEECARIDREIELVHRDRKPNGLDNNLLRQYQAISRACQTIGPAERALRLPMLKQLANSSAEASVRYFLALRSAGVEPSVLSEALMAIHKWALRGDLASAVFLAHSSSAADLGPVEQRALLLALRAMANGSAEDLMHFDHPGWKTPAQRPLSPASLEAQAQVRSQIILADMQAARAAR
ncbi:MAG: hypothetical protein O9335_11245 [Inhella sp.]|uniref:hypothetical protein n=1 Tax=Inhella sp. TaxID=1921806 RepID=UPI0022C1B60A|nr:hypothetical protein [Inhella sp.]MCZ8235718.1 hypothetical protein [Inhella sp.]